MYRTICITFCHLTLGLECDAFDNPADFFLDKMNEAEEDLKPPNPESNIFAFIIIAYSTYFLNVICISCVHTGT